MDRESFWISDAAHLDFDTESFDAVVSNFVFREVHSAKDKRDVVREALRVVKKGGSFSFQDMFSQKSLYWGYGCLCGAVKTGRNFRDSLYRRFREKAGFHSEICENAMDD